MVHKRSPNGPAIGADGASSRSEPASSQPRRVHGPRLGDAWRTANETLRAARNRLEPTVVGQVCRQLAELGFINSSLQFAAVFTVGFIPFLMVPSVALGSDLSLAIVIRSGFTVQAGHDVGALFTHGRTAPATVSIPGLVLAVLGGAAISHMIQTWYATIFRAQIHGWKALARRIQWLAGVFGFVALQVVIGRRIQPVCGPLAAASALFLLAAGFWWWSLHCLLSRQIRWRQLFLAGLATAACYIGLGVYVAYIASSSIITNESTYGLFGAVMTIVTAEIGLGVAVQLGAAIGAAAGRGRNPGRPRSGQPAAPELDGADSPRCKRDR